MVIDSNLTIWQHNNVRWNHVILINWLQRWNTTTIELNELEMCALHGMSLQEMKFSGQWFTRQLNTSAHKIYVCQARRISVENGIHIFIVILIIMNIDNSSICDYSNWYYWTDNNNRMSIISPYIQIYMYYKLHSIKLSFMINKKSKSIGWTDVESWSIEHVERTWYKNQIKYRIYSTMTNKSTLRYRPIIHTHASNPWIRKYRWNAAI